MNAKVGDTVRVGIYRHPTGEHIRDVDAEVVGVEADGTALVRINVAPDADADALDHVRIEPV